MKSLENDWHSNPLLHRKFIQRRKWLIGNSWSIVLNFGGKVFQASGMPKLFSAGKSEAATSPAEVQAQLVISPKAKARARWLLAKDLSRGDVRAVGEPLSYPSASARGQQGGDDAASFLVTR